MAGQTCEACEALLPDGPRRRFCDDPVCKRARARLRKRKSRSDGVVVEFGAKPEPQLGLESVYEATLAELRVAGRVLTSAGQNALRLAARLDGGELDTGSSVAAVSKQHLAALAEALRDAPKADDGIDELRARRAKRVGLGA